MSWEYTQLLIMTAGLLGATLWVLVNKARARSRGVDGSSWEENRGPAFLLLGALTLYICADAIEAWSHGGMTATNYRQTLLAAMVWWSFLSGKMRGEMRVKGAEWLDRPVFR